MYVRRKILPFDSQEARRSRKRTFDLMRQFRVLNEMKPCSEASAEWIMAAISKFKRDHPELKPQIEAYYAYRGELNG